jgi:DNA-binding NarL/FixJ family response regulator
MKQVPGDPAERIAVAMDRIVRLLAGVLLKDIEGGEQKLKVARLKSCGFGNTEIADMLGTTANTINVAVHSLRKKRNRRKKSPK